MAVPRYLVFLLVAAMAVMARPASAGEEVRLNHDGISLNGQLTLADGKTLADGLVLMVHGTLAHNGMDTIQNLVDVFDERGISSLAINLSLGLDDRHGMYDCKTAHRHRHLDAVGEIAAWLDWLAARGAGPVTVLGHSRGGNQVARFAAAGGHKSVQRLVLLAPATWKAEAAAEGFERSHKQPLGPILAKAEALVNAGNGDQILAGIGILYCPGADVSAASFVSYYAPDPGRDTPSVVRNLALPVLVVAAGSDSVVRDLPVKMRPIADGKRLRFVVVDGADHFFLDLYAEDVADALEALDVDG